MSSRLATWYRQLAHQLEAGFTLAESLRLAAGPPSADREAMARQVEKGTPVDEILGQAPSWLPPTDRLFLATAMETGRLPAVLERLAERHEQVAANRMKAVLGLLYPLALYHIAALILPLIPMIDFERGFRWSPTRYLLGALALLLPLWTLVGLVSALARSGGSLLNRILRLLPLFHTYLKTRAIADLADALVAFIAAGVPAPKAWRTAASVVDDPSLRQAIRQMEPVFASGGEPADILEKHPVFPADFRSLYRTGARGGRLDETLAHAARIYQDRAARAMTFAAIVYPAVALAAVAAVLIFNIFRIFGRYLQSFEQFLP